MLKKQMNHPRFRKAQINAIDEEKREFTVCFSTGAAVMRSIGGERISEELEISDSALDLSKLNAGAPLLNSHNLNDVNATVGVVTSSWIDEGKAFATVRVANSDDCNPIVQKINDGIIKNISVGYRTLKEKVFKRSETDEHLTSLATLWKPFELSLVAIGADAGASILRSYGEHETLIIKEDEEEETMKEDLILDERKRVSEILSLAKTHEIDDVRSNSFIKDGLQIEKVREIILDDLARRSKEETITPKIEVGENHTRKGHLEGFQNVIQSKIDPEVELSDAGKKYRNYSLMDMARTCIGEDLNTNYSPLEIAQRSLFSTSDFPIVLGETAKAQLLKSYDSMVRNEMFWDLITVKSAPNFKDMKSIRFGEMPDYLPKNEYGEYQFATLSESEGSWNIGTYGRALGISREMIIADEFDVLSVFSSWGQAAARLVRKMFYSQFNDSDIKTIDNLPLFQKTSGNSKIRATNIAAKGSPVSVAALAEAELAMASHQGLDKREGDYLELQPNYLIAHTSQKAAHDQFFSTQIVPNQIGEANPYRGTFKRIYSMQLKDKDAWYMVADKSQGIGLFSMAFLNGQRNPFVEWKPNFHNDSFEVKSRLDVGICAEDYRGFYKNEGK